MNDECSFLGLRSYYCKFICSFLAGRTLFTPIASCHSVSIQETHGKSVQRVFSERVQFIHAKGSMAPYNDCLLILREELRPSHSVYPLFLRGCGCLGMSPKIVWLPDTNRTLPIIWSMPLEKNILLGTDAPFLPDYHQDSEASTTHLGWL